jgi:hypothetical protein
VNQQRQELPVFLGKMGQMKLPPSLHILPGENAPQVKGIHSASRGRKTSREEFKRHCERLMPKLVGESL